MAAEATVRRPESTSVKTSTRRTSRSLISTHPKVVRLPSDDTAGRAIGHFYRAEEIKVVDTGSGATETNATPDIDKKMQEEETPRGIGTKDRALHLLINPVAQDMS